MDFSPHKCTWALGHKCAKCHRSSGGSHWLPALPSQPSFCCMGMDQAMCFHDALPHGHSGRSLCRSWVLQRQLSCRRRRLTHWLGHRPPVGSGYLIRDNTLSMAASGNRPRSLTSCYFHPIPRILFLFLKQHNYAVSP